MGERIVCLERTFSRPTSVCSNEWARLLGVLACVSGSNRRHAHATSTKVKCSGTHVSENQRKNEPHHLVRRTRICLMDRLIVVHRHSNPFSPEILSGPASVVVVVDL